MLDNGKIVVMGQYSGYNKPTFEKKNPTILFEFFSYIWID